MGSMGNHVDFDGLWQKWMNLPPPMSSSNSEEPERDGVWTGYFGVPLQQHNEATYCK